MFCPAPVCPLAPNRHFTPPCPALAPHTLQAVYCCAILASTQDLAFVYAIAWTALNLLVNPYMALFNLYSLGWGFSWLRYFSPFNYAWQVGGLGTKHTHTYLHACTLAPSVRCSAWPACLP